MAHLKGDNMNKTLQQSLTGSHSVWQLILIVIRLSIPAILAQISSIVMQYIDSAMAGSLGAQASASIGLVSTTTWLTGGLCISLATGFSVQMAQARANTEKRRMFSDSRLSLPFCSG